MIGLLKTVGTVTALGALFLAGQPTRAESFVQHPTDQATSVQLAHAEPQQKVHGMDHHGMMGFAMGNHGMMGAHGYHGGQGMHGYGGDHMMGSDHWSSAALDKELTVDAVKTIFEGRLAMLGNDRLKVGKVEQKDGNTIVAEIVTVDDSLVWRFEVDRKTGRHNPVE